MKLFSKCQSTVEELFDATTFWNYAYTQLTKNMYLNYGNSVHLAKVFEHYNSDIQRDSNRASLQSMAAQLAQTLHKPCCCLSAAVF